MRPLHVAVDVIVDATLIVAVHVHLIPTLVVIRPLNGPPKQCPQTTVDRRPMLSFQKLDVYQTSIEFLVFARRLCQTIPRGHADLRDQLKRAAQSMPPNIAEGAGKTTSADKARYYAIARGSAMESASHLDVMRS